MTPPPTTLSEAAPHSASEAAEPAARDLPPRSGRPGRTGHAGRRFVVGAVAGVVVAGGAAALIARATRHEHHPSAAPSRTLDLSPATTVAGARPDFTPPAVAGGAPAATPDAAVSAFVAAEVDADYTTSFGLLDAKDRSSVGNAGEWRAEHAQLPVYVSFTPSGPAHVAGSTATVEGALELQSTVDQTTGIVPAHGRARFTAVAEDGGWRVEVSQSGFQPEFPDQQGAASAASAWVASRQACDTARDGYDGNLLGQPAVEAALCHSTDRFEVGSVSSLGDAPDNAPFVAAFGPDGAAALRAVKLTGPRPLTVIAAPLGDRWVVVGVE